MSLPQSPERSAIVIDASVWVSRLVPEDEFHQAVKTWMDVQRQSGVIFISPALLLAEVGGAITRRTGEAALGKRAIDQLEELPTIRLVEIDDDLMRTAAQLAAQHGLRGADCIYVAVAHLLDLPLVTIDADQNQRAAAIVNIQMI